MYIREEALILSMAGKNSPYLNFHKFEISEKQINVFFSIEKAKNKIISSSIRMYTVKLVEPLGNLFEKSQMEIKN